MLETVKIKNTRLQDDVMTKSSKSYSSLVFPAHAMQTKGESRGTTPLILNPAVDGGEWLTSCPSHCTWRERAPNIHLTGGSVGPIASLRDLVNKKYLLPCPQDEPYLVLYITYPLYYDILAPQ